MTKYILHVCATTHQRDALMGDKAKHLSALDRCFTALQTGKIIRDHTDDLMHYFRVIQDRQDCDHLAGYVFQEVKFHCILDQELRSIIQSRVRGG